ncbi:MAG: SET domain-containing protein-lysine N-methyltransferase [archaeon]|jgi:hypothetical protein
MLERKFELTDEILFSDKFIDSKKKFLDGVVLIKQPSKIHGVGIFTKTEVPANREFYLVPMTDLRNSSSPRCARIAQNLYVSDEQVLNWINHSCEANSELVFGQNRVVLKSKREIKAGEEITVDYYLTEEKNNLLPCACGSEKCRNFFFIS